MQRLQTEIVRRDRSTLTLLPEVFYSLIQNLKVKYSLNSGRIKAPNNTRVFFTWQVDNKLLKAVLYVKTTAEFTGTLRFLGMTAP